MGVEVEASAAGVAAAASAEPEVVATPPQSSPEASEAPLDEATTHAGPIEAYGFTLYHISATNLGEPDPPSSKEHPMQDQPALGGRRPSSKTRSKRKSKELRAANDLLLWRARSAFTIFVVFFRSQLAW